MSFTAAAKQYITKLSESDPSEELREIYAELKELHEKRLWHQSTLQLEKLVNLPYFNQGKELLELYEKFIKDFEAKINQLKFVRIILTIARQCSDSSQAEAFLQKVSEKINSDKEKEAYSLITTELAFLYAKSDKLGEAKTLADKAGAILEGITGADPFVYSSYYRVLSLYYKIRVMPTEFFRNSLMYLVYTPLESLPLQEQQALAFDLGVAALVAKDIHNFGELLAHPVLKSLAGSSGAWMGELLFAFNSGDIAKYETLLSKYSIQFNQQVALTSNAQLLRQKIALLALMELVFYRTSEQRTVSFQEIAAAAHVHADQVELLVMKAFSLKLIKGSIDELSKTVTVTWVQPRVLDLNQVGKAKDRVAKWISDVNQVLNFLQNETSPELLA